MFRFFCASLPLALSIGIATALYYYFNSKVTRHGNRPYTRNESPTDFTDSSLNDCCGICLEDISRRDKNIVLLECRHRFHVNCIDGILKRPYSQTSCPLCRRAINLNRISTIF